MDENKKESTITEEEMDVIKLLDEQGNEVEYFVDDEFEFNGKNYVVLVENDESDDALLFYIEEEGEDDFILKAVEDDDEFNQVSEYYSNLDVSDDTEE